MANPGGTCGLVETECRDGSACLSPVCREAAVHRPGLDQSILPCGQQNTPTAKPALSNAGIPGDSGRRIPAENNFTSRSDFAGAAFFRLTDLAIHNGSMIEPLDTDSLNFW